MTRQVGSGGNYSIHIRGSGAPELTKVFEKDFERSVQSKLGQGRITYDWGAGASELPPGYQRLLDVLGASAPTKPSVPVKPSPNLPAPSTHETEPNVTTQHDGAAQSKDTTLEPKDSRATQTVSSLLAIRADQSKR
ncbi:MAG: hypothetical protein HYV07_15510 [Deltaproteobacteria bacterium]|nr:hypothetical protein [Deltaproteobacteria bacterium]